MRKIAFLFLIIAMRAMAQSGCPLGGAPYVHFTGEDPVAVKQKIEEYGRCGYRLLSFRNDDEKTGQSYSVMLERDLPTTRDYRYVIRFTRWLGMKNADGVAEAAATIQQIQEAGRQGFRVEESGRDFVSLVRIRGCADRFEYRFRKLDLGDYLELKAAARGGFRPTGRELSLASGFHHIFEKVACPSLDATRSASKARKSHFKYWAQEDGVARFEKALDQGYRLVAAHRGHLYGHCSYTPEDGSWTSDCGEEDIHILMREAGSTTRYSYSLHDIQGLEAMQDFVPPGETKSPLADLGEKGFQPRHFRGNRFDPTMVIFERVLGSKRRFQYRVTASNNLDEFLRRLTAAHADGLRVLLMTWSRAQRYIALSGRVVASDRVEPEGGCASGGGAR